MHGEFSATVSEGDRPVCASLSGNRNFEGRIHPDVRMNYLASLPLVVAYALPARLRSAAIDKIKLDSAVRRLREGPFHRRPASVATALYRQVIPLGHALILTPPDETSG